MNTFIFLVYALAHSLLFGWALTEFLRRRAPSSVPLLLVTAGLVYDNVMIAVGGSVEEGQTLAQLSVPRFFLHALTTPLLVLTGCALAAQAWAPLRHPALTVAVVALTLAMIAAGFWQDMANLALEAEWQGDILSYGNGNADGPPLAPMVTIAVLLTAGVIVWWKAGLPWLTAGAVIQLAAALLGSMAVALGNFGEVALLAGLVVTHWQMRASQPDHRDIRASSVPGSA